MNYFPRFYTRKKVKQTFKIIANFMMSVFAHKDMNCHDEDISELFFIFLKA